MTIWHKATFLLVLHLCGVYGVVQWCLGTYDPTLVRVQCALMVFVGLSATAGGHRLFTHQAYEAVAPVHFVFLLGLVLGFTGSAFGWIRTHRTHHQYTDTDLDPHDARKGLWWSHFGWMLAPRTKAIQTACALQDTHTLRFWHVHWVVDKFYTLLALLANVCLPSLALSAVGVHHLPADHLFVTTAIRVLVGRHSAACVNSLAHLPTVLGTQPWAPTVPSRTSSCRS